MWIQRAQRALLGSAVVVVVEPGVGIGRAGAVGDNVIRLRQDAPATRSCWHPCRAWSRSVWCGVFLAWRWRWLRRKRRLLLLLLLMLLLLLLGWRLRSKESLVVMKGGQDLPQSRPDCQKCLFFGAHSPCCRTPAPIRFPRLGVPVPVPALAPALRLARLARLHPQVPWHVTRREGEDVDGVRPAPPRADQRRRKASGRGGRGPGRNVGARAVENVLPVAGDPVAGGSERVSSLCRGRGRGRGCWRGRGLGHWHR